MKFMERFAVFMEQKGFITKQESQKVIPPLMQSATEPVAAEQWKQVRRRLDMNEEDTENGKRSTTANHSDRDGESGSEITIYKPVVPVSMSSNDNSLEQPNAGEGSQMLLGSSDEFNNTSDESLNAEIITKDVDMINIAEQPMQLVVNRVEGQIPREPVVHSSHQPEPAVVNQTPKERATEVIRKAEKVKERLLQIPGMISEIRNAQDNSVDGRLLAVHNGNLLHSVLVDKEYTAIASHIDENMRRRIILGEYIDFI